MKEFVKRVYNESPKIISSILLLGLLIYIILIFILVILSI